MVLLGAIWRALFGFAVAVIARVLTWTLRVEVTHQTDMLTGPIIYAFLHGHQLALLRFPRPRPTAAIVSHSRDGQLQARVLATLGLEVIRGSSSAGGAAALKSSMEWLEGGRDLALAIDGPRGPAGKAKPGVIWLSQKTRVPIVPVACTASPARHLHGTWDSFMIPLPFARVPIRTGVAFKPWEQDWTQERKLTYLDSLISDLESSARAQIRPAG